MKSILIIGTKDGGKSTTMTEVCKKLNPTNVYKLNTIDKKIEPANVSDIYNNTFIIEVEGKYILVVAGAPTEQNITLKILIEICIEIEIHISLLLVSKRTTERKEGFNTLQDLNDYSLLIHTETVYPIPLTDINDINSFKQDSNWINRINKIYELVKNNI